MSDLFASINGAQIVSGSITIPLYGMWSGDVSLASGPPIADSVTLVLGNLTLVGHVYRQALFAGARALRLVAGAGGWRQVVPSKQYSLGNGVPMSMVLRDAAKEVGERIAVPTESNLGPHFVRENAQASRVLRQVAGPNWYIDPAGATQIAAWPETTVLSDFTIINQVPGPGFVEVATEDYASWLPGVSFTWPTLDATFKNGGVRYVFKNDGTFRFEVLTQ